jgi:CubicO group peptidase (beta-lactamase class C family)
MTESSVRFECKGAGVYSGPARPVKRGLDDRESRRIYLGHEKKPMADLAVNKKKNRSQLGTVLVRVAAVGFIIVLGLYGFSDRSRQGALHQQPAKSPIDALVLEAMSQWHVPGVAVGIVRHNGQIDVRGYGMRRIGQSEAVGPDTIFPIASCTKAFTTTAMAMLVDEGKMRWDDPVRKHVGYFHLADPSADADVRLFDLITHRTGLGANDFLWYRSPWDRREIIRRIGLVPLEHPFRTAFQYQSTMFTVAGCAIESAAGCKWEDFIRTRIGMPLGMKHLCFTSPEAETFEDRAWPHRLEGSGSVVGWAGYRLTAPDPAGSIHASARDLCRWLLFQLGDGSFEGKQLVSRSNFEEMHRPQMVIRKTDAAALLNPESIQMAYGFGWVIQDYQGHRQMSHAGYLDGFRAHLTLMPDDGLGIVLLNNLHDTPMNLPLSNTLVDYLLSLPKRNWHAYIQRQIARLEARPAPVSPAPASLPIAGYAGKYENPAYGVAEITEGGGQLFWSWNNFQGVLQPVSGDTFRIDNELMRRPLARFQIDGGKRAVAIYVEDPVKVAFKKAALRESGS